MNAPRSPKNRVAGETYLFKKTLSVWTGAHWLCAKHNKNRHVCFECKPTSVYSTSFGSGVCLPTPCAENRVANTMYTVAWGKKMLWTGTRFECEHGNKRAHCSDCGSLCQHNRKSCFACKRGQYRVCVHNNRTRNCDVCKPAVKTSLNLESTPKTA